MTGTTRAGDKSFSPSSGDDTDETATDARTARIARNTDGDVLGAAVFLDAGDLADLGVELETTDAGRVSYAVHNGTLRVTVADDDGGDR